MKLKRDYLTVEDLSLIIANMIQHEHSVEREVLKIGLTAQLLIEDLGEFDNCDDIYDLVMKEGIDFSQVRGYDRIDYLVEQEIGMVSVVRDFVKDMNGKISKSIDNLDLKSVVKELGEIANGNENIQKPSRNRQGRKDKV